MITNFYNCFAECTAQSCHFIWFLGLLSQLINLIRWFGHGFAEYRFSDPFNLVLEQILVLKHMYFE